MTRYRLDIAYDGSRFHGWAGQTGLRTVQGELETWVGRVLRLPEAPVLVCAGRTDAGVHARGQVAHLDLALPEPDEVAAMLARRLRRALPEDVIVRRVTVPPAGFDARFAAIWRRYAYRLADGPADPLQRHTTAAVRATVDVGALNAAGEALIGLHDFAAFCRAREGATTIRHLQHLHAVRLDDGRVEIGVRADAFCHSMVRSLVGALVEVGTGRRDAAWLAGLLGAGSRSSEVPVLPAHGLVLEEVGYPPDDQLAARAVEARARRDQEQLP
ncbi:MAG: tRNA pseudouridine(38-40) synthase TruA [Propionicimonas sp.]|uniref:tRNA pseudouridine(38-40) synthase TruA n=1 Tax=Propionicimonas sp. TaxID=1955623 RepID=UPI003D0D0575